MLVALDLCTAAAAATEAGAAACAAAGAAVAEHRQLVERECRM